MLPIKFNSIQFNSTHLDLNVMRDNNEWLLDVLIGHGLKSEVVREKIGKAVASFLAAAMRVRRLCKRQDPIQALSNGWIACSFAATSA